MGGRHSKYKILNLDNNSILTILIGRTGGESAMAHLQIPLSGDVSIRELLSGMPEGPKSTVRKGFSVVAKLPESAHGALLKSVLESAGHRGTTKEEELAKDLGIPVNDATGAVSAMVLFSALIAGSNETPENVLQAIIDLGLASDSEKSALVRILPKLAQINPEVNKVVSRQRLAGAVLPSFRFFEAELDIRIGGKEDAGQKVPVAVALLATDSRDQRVCFQLTKEDVEDLKKELDDLLKKFKEAEELIAKLLSTSGGA